MIGDLETVFARVFAVSYSTLSVLFCVPFILIARPVPYSPTIFLPATRTLLSSSFTLFYETLRLSWAPYAVDPRSALSIYPAHHHS